MDIEQMKGKSVMRDELWPQSTMASIDGLRRLAGSILGLDMEEKDHVHAAAMLDCGEGDYSRAFYEFAKRCEDGLVSGYKLEDMVVVLARKIPPVEDLDIEIWWEDSDIVVLTDAELLAMAEKVANMAPSSPDSALAARILSLKSVGVDRRHFALRYVDYQTRGAKCNRSLALFCSDHNRCQKELLALSDCNNKVIQVGDSYGVLRPQLRPWLDTDSWDTPVECKGFGKGFVPAFEKQQRDVFPQLKWTENVHEMVQIDEKLNWIVDSNAGKQIANGNEENSDFEEELEVVDADPNVLSDEEFGIEDGTHNTLELQHTLCSFENMQQNTFPVASLDKNCGLSAGNNHVAYPPLLSSCNASVPPNNPTVDITAGVGIGQQDVDQKAAEMNLDKAPNIVDMREYGIKAAHADKATNLAKNQKNINNDLIVKDVIDIEWPSLPSNAAKNTSPPMGPEKKQTAWNNKQKKGFMNNGIADKHKKLVYSPPPTVDTDYMIDIARAYSMRDIWGIALLGQYVGRLPGHYAIQSMIKLWGVHAKYRIEEGWVIFNFESEEDQGKVLIGGPYMIHGRPMILKHVPDKFAFSNKDFATVPLWIRIHGLGSRFWTDEFLGGIASYIGKPLYLDPVTDGRRRNSYARVLVEINLAGRIIRKVPIKFSDGESFVCNIQIENEPKYCCECCALGHNVNECSFVKMTAASKALDLRNGLRHQSTGINGCEDTGITLKSDRTVKQHPPVSSVGNMKSNTTATVSVHRNGGHNRAVDVQNEETMDTVDTKGNDRTAVLEQENKVGKKPVFGVIGTSTGEDRTQIITKDISKDAVVLPENTHFVDKNRFSVLSTDDDMLDSTTKKGIQTKHSDDVAAANRSSKPLLAEVGPHTRSRVKGNKVSTFPNERATKIR